MVLTGSFSRGLHSLFINPGVSPRQGRTELSAEGSEGINLPYLCLGTWSSWVGCEKELSEQCLGYEGTEEINTEETQVQMRGGGGWAGQGDERQREIERRKKSACDALIGVKCP